jgi:hypothetical protein
MEDLLSNAELQKGNADLACATVGKADGRHRAEAGGGRHTVVNLRAT